jgi:hypothetical protein
MSSSSTKLKIRAEQALPESEVWGTGGRYAPNNACTYKYMNKKKKIFWGKKRSVNRSWFFNVRLIVCAYFMQGLSLRYPSRWSPS